MKQSLELDMREYLVRVGLIKDDQIKDETAKRKQQIENHSHYHNTLQLLRLYRDIQWLSMPLSPVPQTSDDHDYHIYEQQLCNKWREQSLVKSQALRQRLDEALKQLREKPGDGETLYAVLYESYVCPQKLPIRQIAEKLNYSERQYYRLRQRAVTLLSVQLWSAPNPEVDKWLEIVTLLESAYQE